MADLFRPLIVTAADASTSRVIAAAFGPSGDNIMGRIGLKIINPPEYA